MNRRRIEIISKSIRMMALISTLIFQSFIGGVAAMPQMVNIAKASTLDSWYNSGWSYRRAITINHLKVANTDQTNFPVLISLTDASLKTVANGGKVQINGYDIIFTNQAGNKLDHEIENYDALNGSVVMWVKVPILSSTNDTILYIYYGNSGITSSQENKAGVWDGNFKGVWHLKETGNGNTGDYKDSTLNANDSTNTTSQPTAIAGQIGGAQSFNGTSSYLDMGSKDNLNITNAITISAWLKVTSSADSYLIVKNLSSFGDIVYGWHWISARSGISFFSSGIGVRSTTGSVVSGNLYHVEMTYDGTNIRWYINGNLDYTEAFSGPLATTTGSLVIGKRNGSTSNIVTGSLDEVRISDTARSADWIATEYNNQNSPSTFFALSSEEGYMHHFAVTGSSSQTAGTTRAITLTAINIEGSTNTLYNGDKTITLSGPLAISSNVPTFTDKNGDRINFGSSGTITFTNGLATTNVTLYKAESASIDATDGTYSTSGDAAYDLDTTVSSASLNSFDIIAPASITSEFPFSLALTAKDVYGNTTTGVSSAVNLSVDQGSIDTPSLANTQFIDNGASSGNVTISNIFRNSNIILTATSGNISNTHSFSVIGVSHSGVISSQKPVIDIASVSVGNLSTLPSNITQIAISITPEFSGVSWQDFSREKFAYLNESVETLYLKFRTSSGAASDVIVYTPQSNTSLIMDGDIIKTKDNPDVYVIKLINGKKFKRLILSPRVFSSYQHLKWENIKTIPQEELDRYATSSLVQVANDRNIYELTPNGDTGQRRVYAGNYDRDSVYEINGVDRDSYMLI